jgi:anti-sigma factor RsiW
MSENREDLEARIAAYIDGQLPPAEAARLEVFLANTDPQLAEQIIGMLGDRHRLRSVAKPVAPPDILARVMEQVERATLLNDSNQIEHSPRRWYQSRWIVAASVAVLVGGFSWFVAKSVMTPKIEDPLKPLVSGGPTAAERAAKATADAAKEAAQADRTAFKGSAGKASAGAGLEGRNVASANKDAAEFMKKASEGETVVLDEEKANLAEPIVQQRLNLNKNFAQNGHAEAGRLGYTAVDTPQLALGNISGNAKATRNEPVVMTLVARDAQDFERLRSTLEELITQDPAVARSQFLLLSRYAGNATISNGANTVASNVGGRRDVGAATRKGPSKGENAGAREGAEDDAVKSQVADSSPSNPTAPGGARGQKSEPTTAAAAKVAEHKVAERKSNVTEQNSNYNIYNPKQRNFEVVDNGLSQNAGLANAGAGQGAQNATSGPGTTSGAEQAATKPSAVQVGGVAQSDQRSRGNEQQQALVQNTYANLDNGATPLYRVTLRQEQLQQLANRFRVDSITCGTEAYVITNSNVSRAVVAKTDAVNEDAKEIGKDASLANRGKHSDGDVVTGPATAAAPSTPPALVSPAPAPTATPATANEKLEELKKATEPVGEKHAATQQAAQPQAQAAYSQQKTKDNTPQALPSLSNSGSPWIEAIITMEPPPARQTK